MSSYLDPLYPHNGQTDMKMLQYQMQNQAQEISNISNNVEKLIYIMRDQTEKLDKMTKDINTIFTVGGWFILITICLLIAMYFRW